MSNSIEPVEGGVEVRIFIAAPLESVRDAVNDIHSEMALPGIEDQEKLDAVIQATKNWWFDKVTIAKGKQIENAAEIAAQNLRTDLYNQLNSSPLRGA